MTKLYVLLLATLFAQCANSEANAQLQPKPEPSFMITPGIVPSRPIESGAQSMLVFTNSDSLQLVSIIPSTSQQKAKFIAIVPKMFSHAMRGPQATATSTGPVVTICTQEGDIFCYKQTSERSWVKTAQLNAPGTAKEGLMSVTSEKNTVVAVWLHAMEPKGQSIYAGISNDGGKTWKSREIYSSPDGTTCECCKPSVIMRNNVVYVMFRNWLNGNRDMHIMKSEDGGLSFTKPEQLGSGNWKLNGCPMDGGDIQIDGKQQAVTIWRREGKLYTSVGTGNEIFLAEGKNGSIQETAAGYAYAWTDKGSILVKTPDGRQHLLGEGTLPKLTSMKDGSLLCTWQKDKAIFGWLYKETAQANNVNR